MYLTACDAVENHEFGIWVTRNNAVEVEGSGTVSDNGLYGVYAQHNGSLIFWTNSNYTISNNDQYGIVVAWHSHTREIGRASISGNGFGPTMAIHGSLIQ